LAKVGYLDPSQYAAIDEKLNLPARETAPEQPAQPGTPPADDDQEDEDADAE